MTWCLTSASDPVRTPSSFAVGTAAQVTVAAAGLAAATLWRYRGGRRQTVAVDMRHAAIEFLSEHFASIEGTAPEVTPGTASAGTYQCGDGRWVRLHTNFPHHRAGVLRILGCEYDRQAVATALRSWTAYDLEDAAAENNLCATAMRSFAEWDAHPHGQAVITQPVVKITRIGDAPPRGLPPSDRPLTGVRVLDLTRVIALPGLRPNPWRRTAPMSTAEHRQSEYPESAASHRRYRPRQTVRPSGTAGQGRQRTPEGIAGPG